MTTEIKAPNVHLEQLVRDQLFEFTSNIPGFEIQIPERGPDGKDVREFQEIEDKKKGTLRTVKRTKVIKPGMALSLTNVARKDLHKYFSGLTKNLVETIFKDGVYNRKLFLEMYEDIEK
jgi:hypothetical protein